MYCSRKHAPNFLCHLSINKKIKTIVFVFVPYCLVVSRNVLIKIISTLNIAEHEVANFELIQTFVVII